jgi:hypothetical protein
VNLLFPDPTFPLVAYTKQESSGEKPKKKKTEKKFKKHNTDTLLIH